MKNFIQQFETDRLNIRPTNTDDAAFIYELMNSPKWHQYIGDRQITTIEKAAEYIEIKMIPQLQNLGFSNYTVIRKSDDQKMGTCGLYDREGLDEIDIGFAFLPKFENQGYGYEAAAKLMAVAFTEFGIKTIDAITSKENLASQKLIEKLGMVFKGPITLPGDDEEILLYRRSK